MYQILIFFFVSVSLFSCQEVPSEELILGAWKVDSTYTFYNGFDFTEKKDGIDWAILWYQENGTVKEIKFDTYQEHYYEFIRKDSVDLRDETQKVVSSFRVKFVGQDHMILRKDKLPIFEGKNQDRYELRYFSRTNPPQNIEAFNKLESKASNE